MAILEPFWIYFKKWNNFKQNPKIMKKILLAVSALFLINVMFAQTAQLDVRRNSPSAVMHRTYLTGFENGAVPENQHVMTRNMNHKFFGTTFYDCQSNGSMPSKIFAHNDGTISAVWTTNGDAASTRGTGYNYYNGSYWVKPSTTTDRIENVRTGWGTMTCVGNAEIVASHNGSSALVIGICPQKGSDQWTFTNLQGPAVSNGSSTSTALLWPALASSGNTVHLIACTESDAGYYFNGINCCLVYYRGTFNESNNTITWEEPRVVGNVTPAEVNKFTSDSYAIAAKGNTVAIVAAPGMTKDVFLWKSSDNGTNFTKTVFFETAAAGDTAYRCDGALDVSIDDAGTAHVALGTYMSYIETDTSSTYTWWPGAGYLLYWNESKQPITYSGDQNYADPEALEAAGYTVVERFNLDCDTSLWIVSGWGVDAYAEYGVGVVSFPQLLTQNGKVYLVFCQLMEFPFVDGESSMYYRGVFATKSNDNGQTFSDYSWLSYNNECTYLSSWELFPLDTTTTLGDVREYIESEGESVYPSVAKNLVNGQIIMSWQQDYFAGTGVKDLSQTVCQNESNMFFFTMDADSIGIRNNVHEVCQGLWEDHTGISNRNLSGMKMYPNPASESVNIAFTAENAENGVISVMNLMGQTVYTKTVEVNEGNNMVNIPVKQLNSGVYMVSIRTNTGISTQKLIVK